jgi:hypothetical protein
VLLLARRHLYGAAALTEEASTLCMFKALDSPVDDVRESSLYMLDMLPSAFLAQHMWAVMQMLSDPCLRVRQMAKHTLARVPLWKLSLSEHTPLLLELLHLDMHEERKTALEVLVRFRFTPATLAPHVAVVMRMFLYGRDKEVQELAARVLSRVDTSVLSEHVSMPLEGLDHKAAHPLARALDVLDRLSLESLALYAPVVLRMLLHMWQIVWQTAADIASRLDGTVLAQHAPIIMEAVDHGDTRAQGSALCVLSRLPQVSLAVHAPAVMRMAIFREDRQVREAAIAALRGLHINTLAEHQSVLLQALGHRAAEVRKQALNVFSKLALAGVITLTSTVIQMRVNDSDSSERSWLSRALAHVDASMLTEKHVQMLRDMLGDNRADARKFAVKVMGNLPPAVMAPHIPAMLPLLGDKAKTVRESAMRALKKSE